MTLLLAKSFFYYEFRKLAISCAFWAKGINESFCIFIADQLKLTTLQLNNR